MKDKIEQLYISAIQGEWDSVYFAEQMMGLIGEPFMLVTSDPPAAIEYSKIIEMNKRGWYTPFTDDNSKGYEFTIRGNTLPKERLLKKGAK